MDKIIKIGTRDSELAHMASEYCTRRQLEAFRISKLTLVPIKSTGDLVLDKPII